jgi:hypothetical protein
MFVVHPAHGWWKTENGKLEKCKSAARRFSLSERFQFAVAYG